MSTQPHKAPERKDRRGGGTALVMPHGGRIGNPPFVATDEQRVKVRNLAKSIPVTGSHLIARLMGFSKDTLYRHFSDDLELGRAELAATLGAQMVNRALDAEAVDGKGQKIAKGDLDAQKFVLARLCHWSTKIEHTGEGGGPIRTFDLSSLSPDQRDALLPIIDQLLAATVPIEDGEFSEVADNEQA